MKLQDLQLNEQDNPNIALLRSVLKELKIMRPRLHSYANDDRLAQAISVLDSDPMEIVRTFKELRSLYGKVIGAAGFATYLGKIERLAPNTFISTQKVGELHAALSTINTEAADINFLAEAMSELIIALLEIKKVASDDSDEYRQAIARAALKKMGYNK